MDPTKLPTDNLYKFLAIFGLAIAFFAAYFTEQRREAYDTRIEAALMELAGLRARRAQLESGIGVLERQTSIDPAAVREMRRQMDELLTTGARMQEQTRQIGHLDDQLVKMRRIAYGGGVSGVVVSLIGFALWWFKLQRHLDRTVAASAAPREATVAISPALPSRHPSRRRLWRAASRQAALSGDGIHAGAT